MMNFLRLVVSAMAMFVMAASAHAWGAEGHQVIALMAQAQLTPAAKAEVDRLLAVGTDAEVSHHADDVVSHPDETRDRTNSRNFVKSAGSLRRRQNDRNWLRSTTARTAMHNYPTSYINQYVRIRKGEVRVCNDEVSGVSSSSASD